MKQILRSFKEKRFWPGLVWVATATSTTILHAMGAVYGYRAWVQPGGNALLAGLGVPLNWAALFTVILNLIPGVLTAIMGLLVFLRVARTQNSTGRMAMFTAFMLLTFSLVVNSSLDHIPEQLFFWQLVLTALGFLGSALFFLFIFIFPDGHFRPGWTKLIPYAFLAWMVTWFIYPQYGPSGMSDTTLTLVVVAWLMLALAVQIYRYLRLSTPDQRQQTKLVAFSLIWLMVFGSFEIWLELVLPRIAASGILGQVVYILVEVFSTLIWLIFPAALVMAILRYQLWEIDSLINRALVYTSLTLILTGIYLGGVVVLQNALREITGEESSLAVVGSTLAIAALAGPLRGRLQRFIDRRFYRNRYDTERAVAEFGQVVRNEVGLEHLGNRLLGAVEHTIQPEFASLWLIGEPTEHQGAAQQEGDKAWRMLIEQE